MISLTDSDPLSPGQKSKIPSDNNNTTLTKDGSGEYQE